jgi:hypothetical protein
MLEVADAPAVPPTHPAHGKGPVDGAAALWICRAGTCRPPATTPSAVAEALAA